MANIGITLFSLPGQCKAALHPLLEIDGPSCSKAKMYVPITQITTEFICEKPGYNSAELFTGDLRSGLDSFTQGIFTYVFGEHPVYLSIHFSRSHCPSFALSVYESGLPSEGEEPIEYLEDIFLANDEIEAMLDAVDRYYEKKTGHPDEKRRSLSLQICLAGETVLINEFSNLEPAQMRTIMSHVGEEYVEYFADNKLNLDLCKPEEFENAFWYAICKHLGNEK